MAKKRRTYSAVYKTAARDFAGKVRDLEDRYGSANERTSDGHTVNRQHEMYAVNSILNSVLYAEAHINEFYRELDEHLQAVVGGHREHPPLPKQLYHNIHDTEEDFYDQSWYQKYQFITKHDPDTDTFDREDDVYHRAFLLNLLRNHFVHFKSEWVDASPDPEPPWLGEKLKEQDFEPNPWQPDGAVYFPDRCLGYGCTRWAYDTAIGLTDVFHERVGTLGWYEQLR